MQNYAPHYQSGNVLFLILIAVALFAALSYAVSSSTRSSGSSGTAQEKNKINAAYLHQFPTAVRQATIRMMVSKSLAPTAISFAHPGTADYGTFGTTPENEVFHPLGGATPYQSPPDQINDGSEWIFNGDLEITNVGTTTGTNTSSDLLALLPGISLEMCTEINRAISGTIATPPSLTVAGETNKFTGTFGYAGTITGASINGNEAFCYQSTNLGKYVYFQTILGR